MLTGGCNDCSQGEGNMVLSTDERRVFDGIGSWRVRLWTIASGLMGEWTCRREVGTSGDVPLRVCEWDHFVFCRCPGGVAFISRSELVVEGVLFAGVLQAVPASPGLPGRTACF